VPVRDRHRQTDRTRMWNELLPYIILLPLLSVFKRQLDTLHYSHSFDYYYYIRLTAFYQDNLGRPAPER